MGPIVSRLAYTISDVVLAVGESDGVRRARDRCVSCQKVLVRVSSTEFRDYHDVCMNVCIQADVLRFVVDCYPEAQSEIVIYLIAAASALCFLFRFSICLSAFSSSSSSASFAAAAAAAADGPADGPAAATGDKPLPAVR